MAVFGPFRIYDNYAFDIFGKKASGMDVDKDGSEVEVFKTWTGEATPSGTTTITDDEEGIEGLTLDDDNDGAEDFTTATTTVSRYTDWTRTAKEDVTSIDVKVCNERTWTVRDTVTNKVFEVIDYKVEDGDAIGRFTLSETPLVQGRSYEIVAYDSNPNVMNTIGKTPLEEGGVLDPDPVFTYSEYVCFARGTRIKTISGNVAIEDLRVGDLVITKDNGYQPIRWIGSRKVPAQGNMAPILIREGTLGNSRDLKVSPQHRMLLQGWTAKILFGEFEVLVAAKFLINDHSIVRVEGGDVEYFHVLFDRHQIIFGEGCPSESFHPGKQSFKTLDQATRDELITLFPELEKDNFDSYGSSARMSLKRIEGVLLAQIMLR
jgi:hypothetical protein